jgi:RNA polymerase sigma factor (sigma-70 family)
VKSPGATGLVDRAAEAFAAFRDGDPAGMSQVVDDVTPLLWHTARGQGLSTEAAEEVVQTAWLRLIEHAEAVTEPRAVVKWLVTTTRREAWAVARRSRREVCVEAEHLDRPQIGTPMASAVAAAEQHERLWRLLGTLPQRCQTLLRVIAFCERPDYGAIAESLGMPVGSIGPTRGRCLAKLRHALTNDPTWEDPR